MKDLRGKVVVITGAVGDLGVELCKALVVEHGAKVWACDINDKGLADLEKQLQGQDGLIQCAHVDVCDDKQLKDFAAKVMAREKRLDIWINNAAVAPTVNAFEDISRDRYERGMNIIFGGVVRGTRTALEAMNEYGKGLIVNVASVAGLVAAPYLSEYTAAKHAVVGFTRGLQTELELGDSNIATLLVCPGFFKSKMISSGDSAKFPEWFQWMLSDSQKVSRQIIAAIQKEKRELICTMNGRVTTAMHKFFPGTTRRSSKLLLARNLKDLFLNRFNL